MNAPVIEKLFKCKNYWQMGIFMWNNQNYDYNEHSPSWFPKYKRIDENISIPDYSKLND